MYTVCVIQLTSTQQRITHAGVKHL